MTPEISLAAPASQSSLENLRMAPLLSVCVFVRDIVGELLEALDNSTLCSPAPYCDIPLER